MKDKEVIKKERNFKLKRDLFGLQVEQRTKDGLFNAGLLLQQWNKENPKDRKYLSQFFRLEETQIYLDEVCNIRLEEIQENIHSCNSLKMNTRFKTSVENQSLTDIITTDNFNLTVGSDEQILSIIEFKKGGNSSRGFKPDSCFMDGLLFTKLAFWLNPRYEARVVKWVCDELISNRNLLADNNKEWSATLKKLGATKENKGYKNPNKLLNYIVINDYYKDCRNDFTVEQQQERLTLEKEIIRLNNFGFLKTLEELQNYLSRIYLSKYPNSILPNLD